VLVLGVDTSGKNGSLSLARGDAGSFELLEIIPLAGGSYSAQLIPQLAALLARRNFTKQDIEGFAAVSGPGSFTGLRVGLAAVKALAEVLHRPIAAVSLLEAMAAASGKTGLVLAALDAGRGECYLGKYEVMNQTARLLTESLVTQEQFCGLLASATESATVVTAEAQMAELARSTRAQVTTIDRPGSDAVARIGLEKILAGETVSAEHLEANYIRRSDAEIFSLPKIAHP